MLPTPPLDYLVAFVMCFVLGTLWTMCVGCYASHIRRKAMASHA
ncbi:DC-STAMP domain-containing protein [Burkholderia sp. Bp9099]|nr:DC-STAMP domain-containing protein [Burkholderia sp. Bp9099]